MFDYPYMRAMFSEFYYPDGTQLDYESVMELQKFFMEWFREEREKELLTFPVVTASCLELEDRNGFADDEFVDFLCEEMEKGLSFFVYMSTSADSLSSCCFDGSQLTLTKSSDGINYMTFEELYNSPYGSSKRNFTIFHNGSWVKGKVVKLDKGKHRMYKVVTANNKEQILTDNHINVTDCGDKETSRLSTDDYLLFNTTAIDAVNEKDMKLTYAQGVLIGAYLGDGSKDEYTVNLSLNQSKYDELLPIIGSALEDFNISAEIKLGKVYNNVYPVRINCKELVDIISVWVDGNYCYDKSLDMGCILQSIDFRQGIIDGFYITDGGNSNRIYTTSELLASNIETIITSLGMVSIIDKSDRTSEPVVIRGDSFNRNYPLYCIRWYSRNNKRSMKDIYKVRLNQTYYKIKSIEEVSTDSEYVYCFEVSNVDEPYFTLPNGIITHNCRLRNELAENDFSYSLGAGGVITGSAQVITLNANRLIQTLGLDQLDDVVFRVQKYLTAFKEVYKTYIDAGLLPAYSAGFIDIEKQFITIGVNGLAEAAEFVGLTVSNNAEYKEFCSKFLGTIKRMNTTYRLATGNKVNTEIIPAENLGVKNAKWDREDGLVVNRDCYNSYFYLVEDEESTILDKIELHGDSITQYLDGGSALHANFEQLLTKEQFYSIFRLCMKHGVPYWTFNVKMTCCNDCGYIDAETRTSCTKCGSQNIDWASRVIGYLKRIKNYSEPRQQEAERRFYM